MEKYAQRVAVQCIDNNMQYLWRRHNTSVAAGDTDNAKKQIICWEKNMKKKYAALSICSTVRQDHGPQMLGQVRSTRNNNGVMNKVW